MRFISERIIVEYDPSDTLSVREIMHPMDPFRCHEPFFTHSLADKSKNEYVTAIDFHEHITYFPYAKNTGDICLARYISNFNDINFTKISGQNLFSLPQETIHGLRVGRLDKGMIAVNHRSGLSLESTVTVIDLVKPSRNIAYFDSPIPVNTIDWIWHGPFHLAIGDNKALRIVDVRCPKSLNAVFFENGVKKTALSSTRPLEIACWDGRNILLYDVRRPEVPCNIFKIDLNAGETLLDMKFNPYLTNELFLHTSNYRVMAMQVNPAALIGGRALSNTMYDKWQIITFKHIDRGCTATRHTMKRRENMPCEEVEVPLLDYYDQFEAAKGDEEIPFPTTWQLPSEVDNSIFDRLHEISEYDFEGYLSKAVERVSAEHEYHSSPPKKLYETDGVESFDFVFPGVNGIMCFDRKHFTYRIEVSPKHYEGSVNTYAGSDSVFYYRGLQIQEMIPAQTLTMMCNRLEAGWNAYETSETTLKQLAFKITERNRSMWANWLRNSAIIQYGGKEFVPIGENGMSWKQLVPQLDGPLPEIDLPPYEQPREEEAAGEICKMIAPFFRLFLPDPRPDLPDVQDEELEGPLAPPDNPHRDDAEEKQEFEMSLPSELSQNMRTLCKCHAKMRYYQKKSNERKYMYNPMQKGFFIASSQRIRDKFFRLGWRYVVKPQIMSHRVKVDRRVFKYDVFNDLKKFDRVKPREFQKRVLPPKLIMDSSSVFMKPEYIKEREEKEREMRAKAAQPITAPIGMSLPKLTKQSHDDSRNGSTNTSMLSVASMEEDPERARFMIRAALQLADNDDDNQTTTNPPTPVTATTASTSTASTPVPSAHSTVSTRENDDFEYETAEDAFFGIKKKRMYVVYQPATAPLGLKRYKPDRLSEHTFIRRLEHLMYWGKRRHERKILEGDFEENDKRLSSIKERCTLDLKAALNNHLRVGWQTFYDKYFFFSDKCSYNQLIRKAIQMYNSMCHSGYVKTSFNVAQHERMVFGLKPRFLLKNGLKNLREILELRTGCSMIETTIPKFNHFMNFIQAELPYQIDDLSIQPTEYSPNFRVYKEGELNSQKKKPTAVYDRNDDFMFPTGRLRFCEFEIPPSLMSQIKKQRKPANRKKARCIYLEDLASIRKNTTVHCVRRSQSCPDLALGIFASEEMNYDDEVYTDGVRHYMSEMFLKELREKEQKLDEKEYVTQNETLFGTKITINNSVEHVEKAQNRVSQGTTFVEWDSPMIFVTDGITGENVSRRVVPFPEPQPPRQIKEADSVFEDIPLEVRMSAAKNLHISWLINQPILHTYPGIQILDDERDEMFTLSSTLPRWSKEKRLSRMAKGHEHFINYEKMANEIVSMGLSFDGYDQFVISDETLENEIGYNRLRTPVFEEHSIQHIPSRLMEIMNPSFYGTFDLDKKSRYTIPELAEMRNRRQLQQEILEKRMIRLREPVIEETEHELRREEDLNVEEDDLKTSSDEDESVSTLQPVLQADQEVLIPSMPDSPYSEEDREKIFAIGEDDEEIVGKSGEAREENLVRRKLGVSHDTTEQKIINEKETACGAKHIKDSSTNFDISNDNVICETEAPFGSPVKIVPIGDARDLMANVTKEPKSVTWGGVVEHQIIRPNPSQESRHVDMNFLRELYSMQFSRRVKSSENLPNWLPVRKNSDPTALSLSKGLPRRSSLDQFYKSDEVSSCAACVEEPWPTREICIVCHPDAQIYRCTNIMNLNLPCNTCNSNIYKFSCANYERHASVVNKYRTEFDGVKLETVDNTLKEALAAKVKPAEELSAPWNNRPYRSGEYTAEKLFEACTDRFFQHSQRNQLAEFYHREFHWITWHMDDVKAEKIFVSEQFDVAFDRDADIDMMRDTMNTISQDGEMDMMTTYDQRSGMRIRRWISYSALHTRVQKQNEKVARRKRAAERESKILSGEISVEAAILADIQKRKAKEEAAAKAQVVDVVKTEEERRKAYQLWKKLPIPKFVEDPKQEMPNFKAPKITYGKLFERRPILKNDIVLVTKKKKLKRKPPLRSQKLPLDNTWLNDCLKVAILPPPMTINYPKDSNKWTVPFYSSQLMQLSTRERKERAFRPPTPPPTLKKEYAIMKQLERDFYRKMRINLQKSTKRARIARVMRFRRKLVRFRNIGTLARINKSTNRWEKKWSKAWTTAYRQTLVPISRQSHSVPKLPKQPIHKKYIFAYGHQKLRWRLEKLGQSQQSRLFSSSDSEYCPIVILPSKHHEETKRMVSKNSIKKKKCHSFGNFGKMVTQLNHGLDKPKSTDFVRSVQNYHHDASAFEIGESKRVSRKREKDGKPRQMESENKLKMADVLSKRRSRSVPRQFGRKPRLQITSTRSFSVDIDSRRRKELKRLIRKVAKNSKISLDAPSLKELRLVRKNQTSSTIPVEKSDLAEKPFVVANRSLKDSKKFTILSAQRKTSNWTQKERKMESTRLKQIINCRAIKKSCNNYKRPLFPIPLLNSHEADGNDCFLYGRNHTRQKHFTKRRKVLHHAPTRSRVLNTIRKLKETEKRNKEMMCEKPITPKLVDLHLNPWIPLSRKKLNAASLSIKKTSNFPTLSWHRMLKKLTNYHVKISRVRLDSMQKIKKMKELTDGSDEHTVEIMMEPTPNLKSCLKRGNAARRVLNLFSNPVEKMNQGLVLHEPIQSSTSSFQGADAQTPKSEKSVPKLLKYSFGNVPEENSLIEENGKEITTENVTKEVNTRPDTPLVVDIDDKLILANSFAASTSQTSC
uniref:WD repeat protein mio zinc-ribbon like domain-containing protein n=1 Tax=Caenorhabditis japonica TaxID=281687 RepID=A0A8R1HTL6_CAEJA